MGVIALQLEDYAKAVSNLRIAAQADPNNAVVLKLLVKAQLLLGQRLEVEALLQRMARLSPDDGEVWSLLGRLYQESSRFKEAVPALERAVDLNPADVSGWASLAFTWFGLGDSQQKAVGLFERAVAENERSPKPMAAPYASFATVLLRLGRVAEADKQIRKASTINPRDPTLLEAQRALQARSRLVLAPSAKSEVSPSPRFEDVAAKAGLDFRLEHSPTEESIRSKRCLVALLCWTMTRMDSWISTSRTAPRVRHCARAARATTTAFTRIMGI